MSEKVHEEDVLTDDSIPHNSTNMNSERNGRGDVSPDDVTGTLCKFHGWHRKGNGCPILET